jgi:hypothetical protein
MSQLYEQRWRIERERKRRAYLDRIRQSTDYYHRRHTSVLGDLRAQGLDKYLPREFSEIQARLRRVASLISSDPEKARDLNIKLAAQVSALPAMARATEREFRIREEERQRQMAEMRRKATSDAAKFIVEKMSQFTDPVEQDFAFDDLRALQSEYTGRVVEPDELSRLKNELAQRFESIQGKAAEKARQWKESRSKKNASESLEARLSVQREQIAAERDRVPIEIDAVLARFDAIAQQARSGAMSEEDLERNLVELADAADVVLADETCRREVVKSLVETLGGLGFIVRAPKRLPGEKDEVLISARKPAGQSADFRVSADGRWIAKFEEYEGMGCKADIDRMDAVLQEIYGISLSDKRVEWQNPDRLSVDERPLDSDKGRHRHG